MSSNKKVKEDILDETLEKISLQASELQISHDIHKDDRELEDQIRDTYHKTYVFSIQASFYYLAPRWKRVLKGFTEPPELKVKRAADELDAVIRNVRARCTILTQKRIHDIEVRLKQVEKYTENTNKLEEGKLALANKAICNLTLVAG